MFFASGSSLKILPECAFFSSLALPSSFPVLIDSDKILGWRWIHLGIHASELGECRDSVQRQFRLIGLVKRWVTR